MKFICFGYRQESDWDELPNSDRTALIEQCFAYDDELRRSGH